MSGIKPKSGATNEDEGVTLEGVAKGRKAGPAKGVKSVRWDRDPEILYRLEQVAIMITQRASQRMIAEAMGYSHTTAKKDIDRVYILWEREATESVTRARMFSINQLRSIQSEAWTVWRNMSKEERKKTVNPLRMVLEAEMQIVGLEGTKSPDEISITRKSDVRELSDEELAAIAAGDNAGKRGG